MENITSIKKGSDIELTIDSLAFGGMGVAYFNNMVTFVKNAIPGQKVNARIIKKRSSYLEARSINVIKESPYFINEKCNHFSDCGGCTFQNLDYSHQIAAKEIQVRDIFNRIGKFDDVNCLPIIPCDKIYHYRNKMEFTYSSNEYIPEDEKNRKASSFVLGLHAPGRWDKVLDINTCYIQSSIANDILDFIKQNTEHLIPYNVRSHNGFLKNIIIRKAINTSDIMVIIVTKTENIKSLLPIVNSLIKDFPSITSVINNITSRKSGVSNAEKQIVLYGREYLSEKIGNNIFMVSPDSFFQTNTKQAEKLYNVILEEAQLTGEEIVYDLFCGTGSISIHIAKYAKLVYGFELSNSAVKDAIQNAINNDINNAWFFLGNLENLFRENLEAKNLESPNVLIVDPPRSGLHLKTIEDIIYKNPYKIIYVSCNPSTQARDVSLLCDRGYKIQHLRPIDMFPHTPHIENVVTLISSV